MKVRSRGGDVGAATDTKRFCSVDFQLHMLDIVMLHLSAAGDGVELWEKV